MSNQRKEYHDVRRMAEDLAQSKVEAGKARFQKADPNAEKPRDVYLEACRAVADAFIDDGFVYKKSSQELSRTEYDLICTIGFDSSHQNVAGRRITLSCSAGVASIDFAKRLNELRGIAPAKKLKAEFLAGGQIGNLQEASAWIEWNLANSTDRSKTIDDIVSTIRQLAFPMFLWFENRDEVIQAVSQRSTPWMDMTHAAYYLLCYADKDTVRTAVRNHLIRVPELIWRYRKEFQAMSEQDVSELQEHSSTESAKQLAFLSVRFGLGDFSEGLDSKRLRAEKKAREARTKG